VDRLAATTRTLLKRRGVTVDYIYRIEAPGDSGCAETEVLYLSEGAPMRAYIDWPNGTTRPPAVSLSPGWDLA
jgi:hypothetical protein